MYHRKQGLIVLGIGETETGSFMIRSLTLTSTATGTFVIEFDGVAVSIGIASGLSIEMNHRYDTLKLVSGPTNAQIVAITN